jgi:hypothetical protein
MSTACAPHRILRRTLEFRAASPRAAEAWRRRAPELWRRLAPALERALDDAAGDDAVLRVPRLEVELRAGAEPDAARLAEEFAAALAEALHGRRPVQRAGREPAPAGPVPAAERAREAVRSFLRDGVVPWWAEPRTIPELDAALTAAVAADGDGWLRALIRATPAVALRLATQFSPALAVRLLGQAAERAPAPPASVAGSPTAPTPAGMELLLAALWRLWAAHATPAEAAVRRVQAALARDEARGATAGLTRLEAVERLARQLAEATATPPPSAGPTPPTTMEVASPRPADDMADDGASPPPADAETPPLPGRRAAASSPAAEAVERPETWPEDDAALPVVHAGLVLLAPFLPRFFEAVGVALPAERLTEDHGRAVLWLHALATGSFEADEPDLAVAKLLCGVPFAWPAPRELDADGARRAEVEALLTAVIAHWGALKNTSPQGLRESFLQRPGLLRDAPDGARLRVEHRAWDVLLDRVPWTWRPVRLPWMPGPLFVEWEAHA